MEPVGQWRDDLREFQGEMVLVTVATMDAARRRDDVAIHGVSAGTRSMPQWSPPVGGGTTVNPDVRARFSAFKPQWSPPVSGGTTHGAGVKHPAGSTRRNGARR